MKSIPYALVALMVAAPAFAEQDVSLISGRFHIEVQEMPGNQSFHITLTETAAQEPMDPVNQAGLHMSCLLIPDLAHVSMDDAFDAASVGADRYCQAQFGDDHFGAVDSIGLHATEQAYVARGSCYQAPI